MPCGLEDARPAETPADIRVELALDSISGTVPGNHYQVPMRRNHIQKRTKALAQPPLDAIAHYSPANLLADRNTQAQSNALIAPTADNQMPGSEAVTLSAHTVEILRTD